MSFDSVCENCGKPAEYHSKLILCKRCTTIVEGDFTGKECADCTKYLFCKKSAKQEKAGGVCKEFVVNFPEEVEMDELSTEPVEEVKSVLLICKGFQDRLCKQDSCPHAEPHEPIEEVDCTKEEVCDDVAKGLVVKCVPVDEYRKRPASTITGQLTKKEMKG